MDTGHNIFRDCLQHAVAEPDCTPAFLTEIFQGTCSTKVTSSSLTRRWFYTPAQSIYIFYIIGPIADITLNSSIDSRTATVPGH